VSILTSILPIRIITAARDLPFYSELSTKFHSRSFQYTCMRSWMHITVTSHRRDLLEGEINSIIWLTRRLRRGMNLSLKNGSKQKCHRPKRLRSDGEPKTAHVYWRFSLPFKRRAPLSPAPIPPDHERKAATRYSCEPAY
jgi:hypothetical protein